MSDWIVVGIDPGLKGAFAVMGWPGVVRRAEPLPVIGGEIDVRTLLAEIIEEAGDHHRLRCYIEDVHAMPDQGVTSTFSFGKGFGMILGALRAFGISFTRITPQAWKKVILAGTDRSKEATLRWAQQSYPDVDLVPDRCRKPHDGIADALAIAEYGRRLLLSGKWGNDGETAAGQRPAGRGCSEASRSPARGKGHHGADRSLR